MKISEKIQHRFWIGILIGYCLLVIWVIGRWIGLPLFRWLCELVR